MKNMDGKFEGIVAAAGVVEIRKFGNGLNFWRGMPMPPPGGIRTHHRELMVLV